MKNCNVQGLCLLVVCRCVLVVSATSCMDHYANTFRLRYATPPEKANGVILGKNFAEHFLRSGGGKRAMKNDTIPQQLGLGHVSVKDWRDLSSAFPIPTAPQQAHMCIYCPRIRSDVIYTVSFKPIYRIIVLSPQKDIFLQSRHQAYVNVTPRQTFSKSKWKGDTIFKKVLFHTRKT